MKFNKLFFAAVAFATLAMVSCKKDEPTPVIPTPGGEEEEAPEMPAIANPEAGKTTIAIYAEVCPRGAYLLGTATSWDPATKEPAMFEAVQGAEHWYSITIDYAPDFGGKVCALPSDPDVAGNWAYQWGKNYDPNDPNCDVEEGHDNTVKLAGEGEWEFENGGQPKLIHVADQGVVYIWIKNWATSPIIEAKKLDVCWIKTDWDGGSDDTGWEYREMTAKGDGVFEMEEVWGGKGCNIAADEKGAGEQWYPTDKIEYVGEQAMAGDKVRFTFTSEKMAIGTLKMEIIEKGERPEPQDPVIVTVKFKLPADWTNTPTAWVWATGGEGAAAELVAEGSWWVYTTPEAVPGLNIIVRNGNDWDNGQTVNIENILENTCYQIQEGTGNREVVAVDCE